MNLDRRDEIQNPEIWEYLIAAECLHSRLRGKILPCSSEILTGECHTYRQD